MRFVRSLAAPPDEVDLEAIGDAVGVDEVALAVVFGSYATGDAGPLSDLDIAVQFREDVPPDRRRTLRDELTAAVIGATGVEAVDLLDLDTAGPIAGYNALGYGILVHGDRMEALNLETDFLMRKLDFQWVKDEWDRALEERIRDGSYGDS